MSRSSCLSIPSSFDARDSLPAHPGAERNAPVSDRFEGAPGRPRRSGPPKPVRYERRSIDEEDNCPVPPRYIPLVSFAVGADAYDRFMGRYSAPLAPALADFALIAAGQRVLDVGCGPGALTAELVRRLGPDAVAA